MDLEVKDYVFLSDPVCRQTSLAERSGLVRLWRKDDAPGTSSGRAKLSLPQLFSLNEYLPHADERSWLDGWLPVLKTGDGSGKCIMMFAEGESLLVRLPSGSVLRFPERCPVSAGNSTAASRRSENAGNPISREVLNYYLNRFLRSDGSIDYYGTAVSEYGDLLRAAANDARKQFYITQKGVCL